jgi:hypothetical protein
MPAAFREKLIARNHPRGAFSPEIFAATPRCSSVGFFPPGVDYMQSNLPGGNPLGIFAVKG